MLSDTFSCTVAWKDKILLNESRLELISSIICKMGLLEMTESSIDIKLCSELQKWDGMHTESVPECVSYVET